MNSYTLKTTATITVVLDAESEEQAMEKFFNEFAFGFGFKRTERDPDGSIGQMCKPEVENVEYWGDESA